MLKKLSISVTLLSGVFVLHAEPAGQGVYKQLCSACHGANGEGSPAAPPMKKSEWLQGNRQRIAQILLHGLTGPIKVAGKDYNLYMPAQGALSDTQKVDVLNYVYETWGGGEKLKKSKKYKPYSIVDLEQAKKDSVGRAEAWEANDLLKKYPLIPAKKGPLKKLIMHEYQGEWEFLPDFKTLEPDVAEEEQYGLFSFRNVDKDKGFGAVWDGELKIGKEAQYEFEMDSSDGSRLLINDKVVIELNEIRSLGKPKVTTVRINGGNAKLRLEYFNKSGSRDIFLRYREAGRRWVWLSEQTTSKKAVMPVIDLTPKEGKTAIYNNFIKGSTARTVGVGYPHGQNIAFSTQNCSLDLAWRGKFISAGLHWTARGKGRIGPLSKQVAKLNEGQGAWYIDGKSASVQFKGYKLDNNGQPTFNYQVNGANVQEKFIPKENGMERIITFEDQIEKNLELLLNHNSNAKNPHDLSAGLKIEIPEGIKTTNKNKSFRLLISAKSTKEFTLNYTWKK